MNDSSATTGQKKGFLDKLNQYKEFIIILVFFLGGFFWMFEYFATEKQVTGLSCVMEQNVQMLRGKIGYQFVTGLLEENKNQLSETRFKIRKAKENSEPTSALEHDLKDFEEQRSDFKADRNKFKVKMEDALDKLTKNDCFK